LVLMVSLFRYDRNSVGLVGDVLLG
jgi:hypothetical protein